MFNKVCKQQYVLPCARRNRTSTARAPLTTNRASDQRNRFIRLNLSSIYKMCIHAEQY